jgi:hypothetical protein
MTQFSGSVTGLLVWLSNDGHAFHPSFCFEARRIAEYRRHGARSALVFGS